MALSSMYLLLLCTGAISLAVILHCYKTNYSA